MPMKIDIETSIYSYATLCKCEKGENNVLKSLPCDSIHTYSYG